MHKDNRPTFFTESGQPIRAAGILCYIIKKSFDDNTEKKIWLLRKQDSNFSDTGGKTDSQDKSIIDTAIRETVEETNGRLFSYNHNYYQCKKILEKEIKKQKPVPIYVESCKYIVFPLRLRYKNKFLPLNRFGEKEIHDDLEHSYHWVDRIPNNIHPRLKPIKNMLRDYEKN